MSKKSAIFSVLALLFFLLISSKVVYASSREEVLGLATESSVLQIPPTVQGPGFILPDNPFFFLDQLKQDVRLFFAFTPEARAKVRTNIAGERLAELRFMLAKNNLSAAKIALDGISDNLSQAAVEIGQARLSGRNVEGLAKAINDDIKEKQQTLDVLNTQAKGELKLRVDAIQASLLKSKVKVEDALAQKDLENEISDDLNRKIQENVLEASNSAKELQAQLDELQKEASAAAQASLSRRQNALQKAIAEKNEVLSKLEAKLLGEEKDKQAKLLEAQGKVIQQAREAVAKAQEAAIKFQQVKNAVSAIKNQAVGGVAGSNIVNSAKPTPTESSR